jgi:hypothetical protein
MLRNNFTAESIIRDMSLEIANTSDYEIFSMLSRHENGYDVFDTFALAETERRLEVIRSIIGYDLHPAFVALAGINRVTACMTAEVYRGKIVLQ